MFLLLSVRAYSFEKQTGHQASSRPSISSEHSCHKQRTAGSTVRRFDGWAIRENVLLFPHYLPRLPEKEVPVCLEENEEQSIPTRFYEIELEASDGDGNVTSTTSSVAVHPDDGCNGLDELEVQYYSSLTKECLLKPHIGMGYQFGHFHDSKYCL